MSRARQIPKLYSLRGSLFNVTIANLTPEERNNINKVVDLYHRMRTKGDLQKHGKAFQSACKGTFGLDDENDVDQSMSIAVWRSAAYLLYHSEYSFQCGHCKETHRPTHHGTKTPINQQYPSCPVCDHVRVVHKGDGQFNVDDYVHSDVFSNALLIPMNDPPKSASPIIPIKGARKSDITIDDILNNPEKHIQLVKEFWWNGFRQDLRENKIKQHATKTQHLTEPADLAAMTELQNAILKCQKKCHVYDLQDRYELHVKVLSLKPEFSLTYHYLTQKYSKYKISITNNTTRFTIMKDPLAELVEFSISIAEEVKVVGNNGTNEEDVSLIDMVAHTPDHKESKRMMIDDGIKEFETKDSQLLVYEALPDGLPKRIWAIKTHMNTEDYRTFSHTYPYIDNGEVPKDVHLALYFEVNVREIKAASATIKTYCTALGYTPESLRQTCYS